jgi:opacity protein-like surface antigen
MKVRLAGAAVAALSLGAVSVAGERAWYASIEGGVTYVDLSAQPVTATCPLGSVSIVPPPICTPTDSVDSGTAVIGALGKYLGENLRIEGEVGYRSNEIGNVDTLSHTTVMLNGEWDIPVTEALSLSLGAGLGIDWLSSSETSTYFPGAPSDETAFAYQGVAGLSYALTDTIAITASYRHLETSSDGIVVITDAKLPPPPTGSLPPLATPPAAVVPPGFGAELVDDVSADTVSIGLRFSF